MANQNIIDRKTYEYLDPLKQKVVCPTMYFLPKIHKTPPPGEHFIGRPIISGCTSPTAKISEFVDYFLLPIVTSQPTYVRDTTDLLRKLEETSFPQDVLITSIDVVCFHKSYIYDSLPALMFIGFEALHGEVSMYNYLVCGDTMCVFIYTLAM